MNCLETQSGEITYLYRLRNNSRRRSSIRINDEKLFEDDNNYIDYFLEIGVKPEIFKENFLYTSSLNDLNQKLNPQIISKFPYLNKNSIIINNKIIDKIFSNGFKVIETKNKPDPSFYAIMSDNHLYSVKYKYKYLSCLKIYESIGEYRKLYNKYFNKEEIDTSNNFNDFYIPKCLCFVSVHPYIDKYEEILKTIYEDTMSNKYQNIFLNQLIYELVIKTPKIPLGYKKVLLKTKEKTIDLTEKKINEYPFIHVDLTKLFGLLNLNIILDIFKYILYEGNVIFFSIKIYELTNSIMSFLYLLSPFNYQYQVISVLPKEYYSYMESDLPFIFGVNQTYNPNFFTDNNINLGKKIVCIVDLDEKQYEFIPKNYNTKENPDFPKNIKDRIDNKIQEYYKQLISSSTKSLDKSINKKNNKEKEKIKENNKNKNKPEEKNEQYQTIFYKFMVETFEDYAKYLKKDVIVKNINDMEINDLIDINLYLNIFNNIDREFYKKIFKTKMFKEFISKRIDPKNNKERMEAIFFEEKINERIAEKKMFGKAKIIEQNKLLSSKDYDYLPEPEIIDLSEQKIPKEVIELFKDDSFNKENCIINGYVIQEENNDLKFNYHIFPALLDYKFYLLNVNNYSPAPILYKQVDLINTKISKKTTIQFNKKPIIKKFYLENDLYICYIILWSLTFWYTEEKEKEYRFKKMILILDKITHQKQEIFQLLIENMNQWGATEDEILYVYLRYLNKNLNVNSKIFDIIFPILQKKEMDPKLNLTVQLLKLGKINYKLFLSKLSQNKETFFKRDLKSRNEFEDRIVSDDVRYTCYSKCIGCGNIIDIGKLCANLSLMKLKNQNGIDMVRCTHKSKDGKSCDYYNCLRLKFRYGAELFNPKLSKFSSCNDLNMTLLSTSSLKEKLFELSKSCKDSGKKINIDLFKKEHPLEFWNCIWYFELNEIDISFILPYSYTEKEIIGEINRMTINKSIESHKVNIINDNKNIEIERSNYKSKYFPNDLCEQTVYQFAFLQEIGMISYKNIFMYEDNINYNEIPLLFENVVYEYENESQNEEPTLVRCLTSNYLNQSSSITDNNDLNTSFGTNTPITKKYTNYINFLKQETQKENPTLINSTSSPMLLNNNQKIIKSSKTLNVS